MADDGVVGRKDSVLEPVIAHELPDVLNRVQFRALGRELHDRDVIRHDQVLRRVTARLIYGPRAVFAQRHPGRDLHQMQTHRLSVSPRQNGPGRLLWRDRHDERCASME